MKKRLLFIFLIFVTVFLLGINVYANETSYELGDIDKNGKIEGKDVFECLKVVTKDNDISEVDMNLADIDNDGKLSISDAIRIWTYSQNKDVPITDIEIQPEQINTYLDGKIEVEKVGVETYRAKIIMDKSDIDVIGMEFGIHLENAEIVNVDCDNILYTASRICNITEDNKTLFFSMLTLWGLEKESNVLEVEIKVDDTKDFSRLVFFGQISDYKTSYNDCVVLDDKLLHSNQFATPAPTSSPNTEYVLGDVDNSGEINAADALLVLQYAADIIGNDVDLDERGKYSADVNKDKSINALDALYILQYSAKIIVRFVFTPSENFAILREYINSQGLTDENGDKYVVTDYVELDDSLYLVEKDSIKYDAESKKYIYNYVAEDKYNNIIKYELVLESDGETEIKIDWLTDNFHLEANDQYINNEVTIEKDFRETLSLEKIEYEIPEIYNNNKYLYERVLNEYLNAQMHMAIMSMENYFDYILTIPLSGLGYDNYKYSNDDVYKVTACIYGENSYYDEVMNRIKNFLKENGTVDGNEVYYDMNKSGSGRTLYEYESTNLRMAYNKEYDVAYFYGQIYHKSIDTTSYIYFEFYRNMTVYYDFSLFDFDENDNATCIQELDTFVYTWDVQDGYHLTNNPKIHEFNVVFPENSNPSYDEKLLASYDLYKGFSVLDDYLRKYCDINLSKLRFGF